MRQFEDDQAVPNPRRSPRRRRIAFRLFLVLVIAVALFEGWAYLAMNRATAEAREGGRPFTFDEIEKARTPWPEDQNGAAVLLEIKDSLQGLTKSEDYDELPWIGGGPAKPLGEQWTEEERARAAAFLETAATELEQIDRMKEFRGGRLPFDTNIDLSNFDTYEFAFVRTAIKFKSLQITNRALDGQTASLADDLAIMLNTTQVLAEEPTLIGNLVYIAGNAYTVATLEQVCALTILQLDQMRRIDRLLGPVESNRGLYWGLLGERALGMTATKFIARETANLRSLSYVPGVHAWLLNDLATCLRMYNRMIAATGDTDGGLAISRRIDQELQEMWPFLHPISRTTLPALTKPFEMNLRATAQFRAARAAMAVECYRIERGQFPATLDELIPAYMEKVPADPFDHQPMRYRVAADRIAIYSVGEDLKDDGGDIGPRLKKDQQRKDWGFLLLPPELRGRPASSTAPASGPEHQ